MYVSNDSEINFLTKSSLMLGNLFFFRKHGLRACQDEFLSFLSVKVKEQQTIGYNHYVLSESWGEKHILDPYPLALKALDGNNSMLLLCQYHARHWRNICMFSTPVSTNLMAT